jgi:hypothetical protein
METSAFLENDNAPTETVQDNAETNIVNEEPSGETPAETSETQTAPQNDGELPEFAKRRLGREQKKYERRVAALEAELHAERARANSAQPQSLQSGTIFTDPLTGETVDIATKEGQDHYQYLQKVNERISKQETEKAATEAQRIDREQYDHVYDSFEDAKDRHPDFVQVMTSSGFDEKLVKELANFNDPGSLGYYIGSNPREVARLKNLPAYEVKRELARHLTEMVSKKTVTNAPTPVNKPKDGVSGKSSNTRIKSVQELMEEKREKQRSKRR